MTRPAGSARLSPGEAEREREGRGRLRASTPQRSFNVPPSKATPTAGPPSTDDPPAPPSPYPLPLSLRSGERQSRALRQPQSFSPSHLRSALRNGSASWNSFWVKPSRRSSIFGRMAAIDWA